MRPIPKRISATIRGVLAFILTSYVASVFFPFGAWQMTTDYPGAFLEYRVPSVLIGIVIPILAGLLAWRIVMYGLRGCFKGASAVDDPWTPEATTQEQTHSKAKRLIFKVVMIAYLVTWLYGAPAVQTHMNQQAVQNYKSTLAKPKTPSNDPAIVRMLQLHPSIETSLAFPLLPGVIVSYHEYQITGLWGWGGWKVHLWYIFGVVELGKLGVWIS